MGKLIKLDKSKKRRDKKYDPYKNSPLNTLDKTLKGMDGLKDAIVYDDKGEVKLDSAGKPVFKDIIEFETTTGEINAIWTCIKALLEENLVPPNEIDATFDLMFMIANMERKSTKTFRASLPINYFVGSWHVLNTCRVYHIFKDDKTLDTAIDGLAMKFAKQIDIYHEVKRREKVEEEASPNALLGESPLSAQKDKSYYDNIKPNPVLNLVSDTE